MVYWHEVYSKISFVSKILYLMGSGCENEMELDTSLQSSHRTKPWRYHTMLF